MILDEQLFQTGRYKIREACLVSNNSASDWSSISCGSGRSRSPEFEEGGELRDDVAFAAATDCRPCFCRFRGTTQMSQGGGWQTKGRFGI